jgi:LuxR family transcriptional regulator, quorum-sensing system regulator BjaR1
MASGAGLIALSESFRDISNGVQVLESLENSFRVLGATHFLATGRPLPNRPIEPLILRMNWGDLRHDRTGGQGLRPDDALLRLGLGPNRPFFRSGTAGSEDSEESLLQSELGADAGILGIPICAFLPYQAVVIAGGAGFAIDVAGILAMDTVSIEAFRQLFAIGYLRPERPGDLSARERRVVELSAVGKTASQIATILEISQRTVHAHLQNASEKLRARNKTHTVVQALRYGQISV